MSPRFARVRPEMTADEDNGWPARRTNSRTILCSRSLPPGSAGRAYPFRRKLYGQEIA